MKKFKQIIILFISISIITSCSIEKRHYRAGYFVSSFSKKDNATPKKKQDEKTESKNNDDLSTQPIVASTDNSIII